MRSVGPGDTVNVHGIFLPTGHTSMQNHLLTTTYVDVMNIRRLKEKNTDVQVEASTVSYTHLTLPTILLV